MNLLGSSLAEQRPRSWKSQLAVGRVFELRSRSTKYPPPCGLVITVPDKGWHNGFLRLIDEFGTTGQTPLYSRHHNPDIYLYGIRLDQFNSTRIARRRPDLEKFNADDLALIRYGYDLDFDGRMSSNGGVSIPLTKPTEWMVFWTEPYADGFPYLSPTEAERRVMGGAWHFSEHGGPKDLGFKFGHMHATCHTGKRLDRVRKIVRKYLPSLIETPVHVIRYTNKWGQSCITTEYEGACPPLGDGRTTIIESPEGSMICCGPREALEI